MDKLYAKLLKNDLLENGMVSESLPEYFNSRGLSKVKFKKLKKGSCSSPMAINLLKNDGNNRIMCLPNPVSYQQCVSTIFDDKNSFEKVLDKIEKNKFSHSKILADDRLFNIPIKGYRSKYLESMRDKMFLSIGCKYNLKYDVEKFYDSIYTHYLPAGLIGFQKALSMYRNPPTRSDEYNYMSDVETAIRNMCNGETKGIITGPFISRIFSELLQSEIDEEISKMIGCIKFRRFVDDTEMYLNSKDEAEKNITMLKNIFQKYKLSLKMEKTEINKIPYIDFNSLKEIINIRKTKSDAKKGWYFASQDDFFETIYKAERIQKNGNKGALKYVLKILNGQRNEYGINKDFSDKDKSFLYLLNYLTIYPQYAKEILKIIDRQVCYISESEKLLNEFLKNMISAKQELVCLYIIQILIKNNLNIDETIFIDYIKEFNCNEILRAVFICYICNINEDGKYDDVIKEYKKMITETDGINFKLDDWLSKYILFYYDYIDESEFIESDNFYKNFVLYKTNNIKFIDFDTL